MKKNILIIIFLSFFTNSFAQNENFTHLDSLNIKLRKEKNIDTILAINNKIAIELKNNGAVDDALKVLHKNIKLGEKHNKNIGIGGAYLVLTNIYLYNSILDSAQYYNEKAIYVFSNKIAQESRKILFTKVSHFSK